MLIEVVGNDTKPLWIESTKIVGVSAKPPAMCIINVACGEKTEEWHLCDDADRVRRAVDEANGIVMEDDGILIDLDHIKRAEALLDKEKRIKELEWKLAKMVRWLDEHQTDVWKRGLWEALEPIYPIDEECKHELGEETTCPCGVKVEEREGLAESDERGVDEVGA